MAKTTLSVHRSAPRVKERQIRRGTLEGKKTRSNHNEADDEWLGTYHSEEEAGKKSKSGGGAHLVRRRQRNG
jgi:hypothetical protein